jgi:uncharacterized cupin superfamily protein
VGNATEISAPLIVNLDDLEWETARYPDEDFDRGDYRDIGGALGCRTIGANIHCLQSGQENARYHAHEYEEEVFLVLEGHPTLRLDGHSFHLNKGHIVHCPPWSAHTFRNEADDACAILMASNHCGRPDAVYPRWKEARREPGSRTDLDPRDERVRHSAELGWDNDPHGREWGGFRNVTEKMGLKNVGCRVHTLRPGALIPYRAHTAAEVLYVVLGGAVEMLRNGECFQMRAGDATWIPPCCPHAFRVRTRNQVKLFAFQDCPPSDQIETPLALAGWEEPVRL